MAVSEGTLRVFAICLYIYVFEHLYLSNVLLDRSFVFVSFKSFKETQRVLLMEDLARRDATVRARAEKLAQGRISA